MGRSLVAPLVSMLIVASCSGNDNGEVESAQCSEAVALPALESRLQFTEVTTDVGLNIMQWTGVDWVESSPDEALVARRQMFGAASMSGGAAVGDVNGDGWEDLYLTRVEQPNVLLLNDCGKRFEDVSTDSGLALDGNSTTAVFGDIDSDGDIDALVGGLGDTPNRLLRNDGSGRFGAPTTLGSPVDMNLTFGLTLSDVNQDGALDVFISQWQSFFSGLRSGNSELLLNAGDGRFESFDDSGMFDVLAAFTTVASDINDDGRPDLLVAGDWGTSRLFLNDGAGGFRDVTTLAGVGTDENGMGAVVIDIDGDTDLDWFVTSVYAGQNCGSREFGCTGNRLYLNDGTGVFVDATDQYGVRDGGWGWGAAAADFDNDGDLDLVMTNGFEGPRTYEEPTGSYLPYVTDTMRFWENDGTLPWTERAAEIGLVDDGQGKALLPWDFDRDGDLDILVIRTSDTPALYRNDLASGAAWLVVEVTHDGAPVVDARVTAVTRDGLTYRRDIRVGATFQGSAAPSAHFGFGSSPTADETVALTVEHPILGSTRLDVGVNQYVTVELG